MKLENPEDASKKKIITPPPLKNHPQNYILESPALNVEEKMLENPLNAEFEENLKQKYDNLKWYKKIGRLVTPFFYSYDKKWVNS